jgi:hypothetical protein
MVVLFQVFIVYATSIYFIVAYMQIRHLYFHQKYSFFKDNHNRQSILSKCLGIFYKLQM